MSELRKLLERLEHKIGTAERVRDCVADSPPEERDHTTEWHSGKIVGYRRVRDMIAEEIEMSEKMDTIAAMDPSDRMLSSYVPASGEARWKLRVVRSDSPASPWRQRLRYIGTWYQCWRMMQEMQSIHVGASEGGSEVVMTLSPATDGE